jgi:hypothetical protein
MGRRQEAFVAEKRPCERTPNRAVRAEFGPTKILPWVLDAKALLWPWHQALLASGAKLWPVCIGQAQTLVTLQFFTIT